MCAHQSYSLCSLLLCILTAGCHNPLYIACVFMHIVPHKSRLWIVCSTVSCVHVQNTNAVLFQGLYRLQAFAESMSKCLDSHCFLPVSKYYMNQYQLSNTLQRKCGLLGTVYCQFSRMSQNGLFEDRCRLFCRSVLWNEEISKSMVPSSGLF